VNFCSVPLPLDESVMTFVLATASACVLYSLIVPLPPTLT